ncbi:MAG: 50S ribosomal protein L9 [Phycisphaerales bacterium]
MSKTVTLLLTDNVDSLGIVGDVVTVRSGYARNYLLPRGLVTEPSDDKISALSQRRAEAEAAVSLQRQEREKLIERLEGVEIELVRSCNDLGMLYGSVTQQDVAEARVKAGFGVKARDVRLPAAIKRVDHYELTIKLAQDLEAGVKLNVKADRILERELRAQEDAAKQAAWEARKAAEKAGSAGAVPAEASNATDGERSRKPRKARSDG